MESVRYSRGVIEDDSVVTYGSNVSGDRVIDAEEVTWKLQLE